MAKKQSFGDKVAKQKATSKNMAKVITAERKSNGQYRFKEKMVQIDRVQDELKAARA